MFSTECFDSTRCLDGASRVASRGTNTFELTLAQSVSFAASEHNGIMGSSSDNADDEPSSSISRAGHVSRREEHARGCQDSPTTSRAFS